jgi:GntR family transcriptional regulator
MEIRIQKDSPISLHEQIVTQISWQITSSQIKPGSKLLSIRALSQKIDVHHNTCLTAYRQLEKNGLIELRHGSGAWVKVLDTDQRSAASTAMDLQSLAEFFITEIGKRGTDWPTALLALEAAHQRLTEGRRELVFVDLHDDILPVFKAELELGLETNVRAVSLNSLLPEQETQSHFIVSRYHFQALKQKLKSHRANAEELKHRISMIDLGSGQNELGLIRDLPVGTVIVVISVSSSILRQSEAVIHALCGDTLLVRTVLYGEEPVLEIRKLLQRSKFIFTDSACLPHLEEISAKHLQVIQTIPSHEMSRLKLLLGNESNANEANHV